MREYAGEKCGNAGICGNCQLATQLHKLLAKVIYLQIEDSIEIQSRGLIMLIAPLEPLEFCSVIVASYSPNILALDL